MVAVAVFWILCGAVTGIVASSKGKNGIGWFLLGCILGIFGIILIALLPSEKPNVVQVANAWPELSPTFAYKSRLGSWPDARSTAVMSGTASKPSSTYDLRRWQVLKEVDPDIAGAAARVAALDAKLKAELAEKYLTLNDKNYLTALEEGLTERVMSKRRELEALKAMTSEADAISSQRELDDYNIALRQNDNYEPRVNIKVVKIEPYIGRWEPARGGIKITLENGQVILKKGYFQRRFNSGEETYE